MFRNILLTTTGTVSLSSSSNPSKPNKKRRLPRSLLFYYPPNPSLPTSRLIPLCLLCHPSLPIPPHPSLPPLPSLPASNLSPPLGANPTVSGSLAAGSFASLPIQPQPSSWGESYCVRQFGSRILRLPASRLSPPLGANPTVSGSLAAGSFASLSSSLIPPLGANPTVSGSLAAGSFASLPPSEIFSSLTSSV